MIQEKKYINDLEPQISIDTRDEETVIVSNKGHTRIWVEGKEIKNVTGITFCHKSDDIVALDLKIEP